MKLKSNFSSTGASSMKTRSVLLTALLAAAVAGPTTLALAAPARGDEASMPVLRIQDGRFEPATLVVEARTAFRLKVVNTGKDAVEFESFELNRERVVAPGQEVVVHLPALEPGSYRIFDDFHRDAGQGTIQAR
jgi:hypothetical protein